MIPLGHNTAARREREIKSDSNFGDVSIASKLFASSDICVNFCLRQFLKASIDICVNFGMRQ
jgi:hypothetical protein